ncbi:hypothetical protein AV656_05570 [Bhargavaea cecembensis]|uniref:Phosphoribosyltransferase domain-containing protein n=1 Tax=Bhargavaea cecembensis TaxID=394098 RepID=A0A165H0B4_9BACL|nr:phosphoribosyltransferase family protein [Bhargavaea cecembensis]KZE38384.1 hypothetical protein AV656_05570 [Bhargavaea cecembensis]
MECLLCDSPVSRPPTWKGLFTDRGKSRLCPRCEEGFVPAEGSPLLGDWDGTPYEGALDAAVSLYVYNDAMKNYLRQYKFLKDAALAGVFSDAIRQAPILKRRKAVPVPMHPERLSERTFPQVEEMLAFAGIPFVPLLEKTTARNLGKMGREERRASEPLFCLAENAEVRQADYVLVDDLYTTGTTLHHAAHVLKNSGARSVAALTLIRA